MTEIAKKKALATPKSDGSPDLPKDVKGDLLVQYANPALQKRSQRSAEKLLDSAETVLKRDGWEGFTINAVANEAGVSVGGIYRRFENKEQLLRAIKDHVLQRSDAAQKAIAASCEATTLDQAVDHYVSRRVAALRSASSPLRQIFEGQQGDLVMEERGRQSLNLGLRMFRSVIAPHRSQIMHPDPELAIEMAFFMVTAIFMRRVRSPLCDSLLDHLDWDVIEAEVRDTIMLYLSQPRPVSSLEK